jgi:glycerophosphoryl diester phosphodiesterase
MSETLPFPAIFAHRGSSALAPENTLTAFQYAVDQQADGIELDVHLTADGEVVVIHDADLSRTTDGSGMVYEKNLAEIKKLDAGGWFGTEFSGEQIPTLTEALELIGGRLLVNIELKGPGFFKSELPVKVIEVVRRYSFIDRLIISSFNPWQLHEIKRLIPELKIGMLIPPGRFSEVSRALSKLLVAPWAYHPHFRSVTPAFCQRVEREGRRILAYTVNKAEDIKRLSGLGVFGIFTDDPSIALAMRAETIR